MESKLDLQISTWWQADRICTKLLHTLSRMDSQHGQGEDSHTQGGEIAWGSQYLKTSGDGSSRACIIADGLGWKQTPLVDLYRFVRGQRRGCRSQKFPQRVRIHCHRADIDESGQGIGLKRLKLAG